MNAFIVELEDKAGELARVTGPIAEVGIDIVGFAGATASGKGTVVLLTNDEAGTRYALRSTGVTFREVATVTALLEGKPGSLAETARKLAAAGVNIEAAMPTGMVGSQVEVAFATAEPDKARAALGDAAS